MSDVNTGSPLVHYFGEPWPTGICEDGQQVSTPIGEVCLLCDEPIVEGDQGTFCGHRPTDELLLFAPVHRECVLRSTVGGIGHYEDHDRWCNQERDPDGGRTFRQSALEVWRRIVNEGSPPS